MKRGILTIIFTITCLMMVGVAFQASAEENADQNSNVLNINGTLISQEQFSRELTNELNKNAGESLTEEELNTKVQKVLDNIIKNELVYQEAQKCGIFVSDAEINQKFNSEKSKFASEEEYLKANNADEATRKAEIKRNLANNRLINQKIVSTITVTDDEIKKYYNDNQDQFTDKTLEQAQEGISRIIKLNKAADSYTQLCADLKKHAKVEVLIK